MFHPGLARQHPYNPSLLRFTAIRITVMEVAEEISIVFPVQEYVENDESDKDQARIIMNVNPPGTGHPKNTFSIQRIPATLVSACRQEDKEDESRKGREDECNQCTDIDNSVLFRSADHMLLRMTLPKKKSDALNFRR